MHNTFIELEFYAATITTDSSLNFEVSCTGVRQSQTRLEKPGGATRQGSGLGMSVSRIVHDR